MESLNSAKGELTAKPFEIILNSDILKEDDLLAVQEMKEELAHGFIKGQVFRTPTEMRVSVLNDVKFPTASAKYWQAVREQGVMFHELTMLSYEYRKNLVEIRQLQAKDPGDEFEQELNQIEIEKKTFIARNQERTAKARIEELKEWSKIKTALAEDMTEGELADVDCHQLVSYTARWIRQALAGGSLTGPEAQNLKGQLDTAIRTVREKGLESELKKLITPGEAKEIGLTG